MTQIPISIAVYWNPLIDKWIMLIFNPTFLKESTTLVLNKRFRQFDDLGKAKAEAIKEAKFLSKKGYSVKVIEGRGEKPYIIWRSDSNE